jgi:rhodanese-related sulfurtransferase
MSFQFIEPNAIENLRSKHPNVLMIDVRDQANHAAQHLPHSFCVPLDDLATSDFFAPESAEHVADPSRPVLLICQLGKRAIMAAQTLENRIDNPLFVLSGGLAACIEFNLELIQAGDL